ncbi:SH3 domain-containing protein [Gracilibacillus alcaliphilus]|uniref:SH3 domain-containing protein n=1 Tax=Gracilibacillus alcaliphilus TaxID=1401441 RepID=UPI00195BC6F1|nr:SH3 domain-containing protein [Gracilibacillus alcaliphilus]MBM7678417.1 beta-N-acetylglucosaminidase [Gracilibacillus alcaliphilus]
MRIVAITKRFLISTLILFLIFPQLNLAALEIDRTKPEDDIPELLYVYNRENDEDFIYLYNEQTTLEENILTEIPNGSEIIILEDGVDDQIHTDTITDFVLVEYTADFIENEEEEITYQGYILADYIFNEEELEEILNYVENEAVEEEKQADLETDAGSEGNMESDLEENEADSDSDVDSDLEENEADNDSDVDSDLEENEADSDSDVDSDLEENEADSDSDVDSDLEENEADSDSDVDSDLEENEADSDSDVDSDLEENEADNDSDVDSDLEENEADNDSDVDSDLEENKTDVESNASFKQAKAFSSFSMNIQSFSATNQQQYTGIALQNRTNVYQSQSSNSNILKSYAQGSILKYRENTGNWYRARVYAGGKWQWGYIHKSHVENATNNQQLIEGIAKQSTTRVYESASTGANTLKSYSAGHILKYRTFSNNWYQARVRVNGEWKLGYIHKNHVENATNNQQVIEGIAKQSTTRVYQSASTSSNTLKSYSAGHILKYRTFSNNWYQAKVRVNGEWKLGYIHKNHVENATNNQQVIEGIAKQSTTRVYQSASTSSNTLKSYSAGHILKYRTYTSDWYQARVRVNGEWKLGYIHKNHVETATSNKVSTQGYGNKKPTNVYASASKSSKALKSYSYGSLLKFRTFTSEWYQTNVYINGKKHTGYIHKSDISANPLQTVKHTNVSYNYTFKHMVDRQMAGTPKSDGAGLVAATRGEVEFFANPNNFGRNSQEYYQFLSLSSPTGLTSAQLNNMVLDSSKGTLSGTGQAFIQAGRNNNMNEAYLIAHALHETGNGKSTLAKGVPVDGKGNITRNSNGQIAVTSQTKHTVYNMYGIAAVDNNPTNVGAKYAFDRGWFTPEAAIIGGADFISSYINRGQDTLYKMRWNPANPGYPQYATHVRWATSQTKNIYNIYQTLSSYSATFEVPTFNNTPTTGRVNASTLNVRSGPSTSNSTVGQLANGANVTIIGANTNGWYQIRSGNTSGWVSASYINLNH